MNQPDFNDMATWLHEHDLASKLEGWLITNDSDNICSIARLDDPSSMVGIPGWPEDFTEPKFQNDNGAIEYVRQKAADGSQWHAQAIAIHDARIPLSVWLPDSDTPSPSNKPNAKRLLHKQILEHCSAGPWQHGLYLPAFSADSQPCVYGDERELPLAILEADDQEASANVVLMAAAWEFCKELSTLVDAALAAEREKVPGTEASELRERCNSALVLLSRISSDIQKSVAERYGEEERHE